MYNVRYKTNVSFLLARYNRVNLAGTSACFAEHLRQMEAVEINNGAKLISAGGDTCRYAKRQALAWRFWL
jgi:hypothetical protein